MRPIRFIFDKDFINAAKAEDERVAIQSFIDFQAKRKPSKEQDYKNTLQNINQSMSHILRTMLADPRYDQPSPEDDQAQLQGISWLLNSGANENELNTLTIEKYKKQLKDQGYASDEPLQNYILKLLLQNRVGVQFRFSSWFTAWLSELTGDTDNIPSHTTKVTLKKETNDRLLLTIIYEHEYIKTDIDENDIEKNAMKKTPFAKTKIELIIKPDCTCELKEASIDITPTIKNQKICQKIRDAYQKGIETDEKPEEKTIPITRNALNALTGWKGFALLISIFMVLSFTGVFSPFAFITGALGLNLELGTLTLIGLDAILAFIAWGSTIALRAITEKTIAQVKEFIPEEFFVKHVPVTVPASISAPPTPPVSPTQAVIEGNSPPQSTESSPRKIKTDSRDPSPSASGTPSSSSDNDTESDEEKMMAKEKSSFPTEIKISSQPVTESNSGSEGSGHSSEDEAEHKGIIIAVPPRADTQASNPPTPENISPRTAGEITAVLGTSTASSGSSNESEGDSDEEKGKSSPNNASPTTNKRRATSKSNPIQLATAGDLSAATDAASFKPVLEKQPPAQTEEKAETIGSLILNNNQGSPTQSL